MTAQPTDNPPEPALDSAHEHDTQGAAPHGDGRPRHETFVLDLEGREYLWHEDTITVAQLRELAGWPADQQVVEIDPKTNTETTLDDNTPIKLDDRHHFGRKFKFKRGQR